LTEFFILTANWCWHGRGFGSGNTAFLRWNAHALLILQETWLAEASDDALLSADAWMGVGAGGFACRSTRQEQLVVFALRYFGWIGEERDWFGSIAFSGGHADSIGISQMSFLAEATDNAILGAEGAWLWVCAGGSASRATFQEFFIIGTYREGTVWNLERNFGMGFAITFISTHAFAFLVLHESFLAEATSDAS
jgi:hypothetical protein